MLLPPPLAFREQLPGSDPQPGGGGDHGRWLQTLKRAIFWALLSLGFVMTVSPRRLGKHNTRGVTELQKHIHFIYIDQ